MPDVLDGVTLPLAMAEDSVSGVLAEVALCGHTTRRQGGPVWTDLTIHIRHAETGATLGTVEVPAPLVDAVATAMSAAVDQLPAGGGAP